jgi:hypothetical protein
MRSPQLVVLDQDGWLARQLQEFARTRRWLLREARQLGAAKGLLTPPRPTVLVAQLDPKREKADGLQFLADVHLTRPDVATLAVSDVKLNDDNDRAAWTELALDLGARGVLFPPLTRPVLEEIVGQMMTAVLARTRPGWQPPEGKDDVIDLAEEGLAE